MFIYVYQDDIGIIPSITHNWVSMFLVGAFLKKRARLLQSLVFFIWDRLEATNVKINVQLLNKY